MRALILIIVSTMLVSCGKAPVGKEPSKSEQSPIAKPNGSLADKEVKAEKKSIEEAADAAAKLVEEEARQEIEAYQGSMDGQANK